MTFVLYFRLCHSENLKEYLYIYIFLCRNNNFRKTIAIHERAKKFFDLIRDLRFFFLAMAVSLKRLKLYFNDILNVHIIERNVVQ